MSIPHKDIHWKFILGILYKNLPLEIIIEKLKEEFGAIEDITSTFPFQHTSYYEKEMGQNISRFWVAFKKMRSVKDFVTIKYQALKLEKKWSKHNKRCVNIDPGFLSLHNFILLSFKNFSHRIPLGKGVYADLTLMYRSSRGFVKLPWTYADYQNEDFLSFLIGLRNKHKKQFK